MPAIRKTGKYVANKSDMNKIQELNKRLDNFQTEINFYNDKYTFVPSQHGYIYICEDKQIKNGIDMNCFKIGFDLDMKKRMIEYKVGNFKHKLLSYIPLQIDRKQIEKCVKTRLKLHLTKLVTDTVCYTDLKNLKNEIIDCINFTKQHIFHCVKCSETYNLDLIDTYKCNLHHIKEFIDYKPTKNIPKTSSKKTSKKSSKKSSKNLLKNFLKK